MPEEKLTRREILAAVLGASALAVAGCSPEPEKSPVTTVEQASTQRLSSGYKLVFPASRLCGDFHDLESIRAVGKKFPSLDVIAINTSDQPEYFPILETVPGRRVNYTSEGKISQELAQYGLSIIEKRVAFVKPDGSYTLLDSKDANFLDTITKAMPVTPAKQQQR